MQEWGLPIISDDTIGSSQYSRIPSSAPWDASFMALFTSSLVTLFFNVATRSVMEPSTTGTLRAIPSSLPLSSGITSPIAFAAPVVVGMMLTAALLALRRALCIRSAAFWSFVYAWMVVIRPFSIPNLSLSTFAIGARELVVHEALEMILCSGLRALRPEHRSEEHTSELQSRLHLVCRLLLVK